MNVPGTEPNTNLGRGHIFIEVFPADEDLNDLADRCREGLREQGIAQIRGGTHLSFFSLRLPGMHRFVAYTFKDSLDIWKRGWEELAHRENRRTACLTPTECHLSDGTSLPLESCLIEKI
jgi:hypothetical protein